MRTAAESFDRENAVMISYVPMKKTHIDDLCSVEEQCFHSGFARQTFERELENRISDYIVAEDGGTAVGYAGMWSVCGVADIMNVGVRPDCRRRGIARGMLDALIAVCSGKGITEINLEVRESNVPARALYKKLGFCEFGIRCGYYDGKEDAVLMKLQLSEENTDENTCD